MKSNKNIISASVLVVLIGIVSFLLVRQLSKKTHQEDALIMEDKALMNKELDEEQDEYYEIPSENEELKHEVFITDNMNLDWFHSNIEKLNGTQFLNNNKFFNYKEDLKNKTYYLIGASMKSLNKALKFRDQLNKEGFRSIILPTKIGFYRVSLQAYDASQKELAEEEYFEARKNKRFTNAWIFENLGE